MLCQRCNIREANVYYTQVVNGVKQEINLCSECANESDIKMNLGGFYGLEDFLTGFMSDSYSFQKPAIAPEKKCQGCGMTLAEFKKGGRLGCESCYDAFAKTLENVFSNVQAGLKHKGRLPHGLGKVVEEKDKLNELKIKLTEAIANEEFEVAAKLRDEIKELQGGDK